MTAHRRWTMPAGVLDLPEGHRQACTRGQPRAGLHKTTHPFGQSTAVASLAAEGVAGPVRVRGRPKELALQPGNGVRRDDGG